MISRMYMIAIAISLLTNVNAQQLTVPQPSPTQLTKQNFGLSFIELSYSRPGVKGRKIFGELVPFDKVWRTGANTPTTLTFGDEVMIDGKKIPAGKYGLLTIPGKESWTVIITKQTDVSDAEAYKQENDIVRITAKTTRMNNKVETFTIEFANIKPEATDLEIKWDDVSVTLPISAESDKKVMAQIDNLLKDNRPYLNAGMYYLNNGKDVNKAIGFFDQAILQNPKSIAAYHQKANALVKQNKKDEAKTAATKSLELAKEAKNTNYIQLNEKLLGDLK